MAVVGLSLDQARDAVGLFVEQQWQTNATYGDIPITYGGFEFDPDSETSNDVGYVEVLFLPGDSVQTATSGGSSGTPWRQFGLVMIDIFSPLGEGESVPLAKSQVITSALTGQDISGVQLRGPSVVVVGPSSDWFHISITFDFFYDYFIT